MTRLVVKAHRPWRARLLALSTVAGLVLLGWGVYQLGHRQAWQAQDAAVGEIAELRQHIAELESSNTALREQKTILERSRQIEKQADAEVNGTLHNLQEEVLELKEELTFYRSVIAPQEGQEGLRIQNFRLQARSVPGGYHYKLVLTQVLRNNTRHVRGTVRLWFEGMQGGEYRQLSLREVATPPREKELSFRFKYFQNLEGEVALPDGFLLSQVRVEVLPRGKNQSKIEQTYPWSEQPE